MSENYRAPIVVVVGHVDVGKTLLLDKIRNTMVAYREPGMITQHIGLSYLPWPIIEKYAAPVIERYRLKGKVWVKGFLMVDTPGHAAFSNLRRRGGSVADLAILVIDLTRGFEEQTYESLILLKSRNIPFVVAANKVDRIYGWKPIPNASILDSYNAQDEETQGRLEEALANIIMDFNKQGFEAERFDRITDFSRQVPIVPTSAVTGEGIPDLLVLMAGLTQRLVKDRLRLVGGPGKGVVMEVKEEKGLGTTMDVVLYDGVMRKGDTIVAMGLNGPVVTRIRMMVMPKPLDEMRDPEDKYMHINEVEAAAGVKVIADGLDDVVPGSSVYVVQGDPKPYIDEVVKDAASVKIETDQIGVVAKADTLGTLEAMVLYLRSQGIPVRKADIGPVTRRDIIDASVVRRKNPLYGVVLAFNVKVPKEVEEEAKVQLVTIFQNNILYRLVEEFTKWFNEEKSRLIESELSKYVRPGKIAIIPGYVFRRSDPAIVGVEVLGGLIKPGYRLVKANGKEVGVIMQIQDKGKPIQVAKKGMSVAISIEGNVIVGRHIKEGDVLYVNVPLEHAVKLIMQYKDHLSSDEVEVLEEFMKLRSTWKAQAQ
ncbi:translation initiation factor IF-2 [Caldivirga maquilingensis]|uniref:Probable translation initiation factor IF-2 n=1 Tax=Caldivirga maquilingensis (strain ATCC 700844 / DSM 13496 / JCM 10307 / IC-167) TaxID=397948 RepID=IF2P_CALMQ|nr:translation initiation factor IF-2 [Caldivirga maquilingensis]A8MBV9.1 RecName: Full=Probable translation initiation factor IF-2 [Caldivirga maquilingensis IC-167]ABW01302.1 translation initiation factor aIF-2 [Caldivirga maquilingensis IC-167]